jgi:hypothetical protein
MTLCVLLCGINVAAQTNAWQTLFDLATRAFERTQHTDAERFLRAALKEAERLSQDGPEMFLTVYGFGELYLA